MRHLSPKFVYFRNISCCILQMQQMCWTCCVAILYGNLLCNIKINLMNVSWFIAVCRWIWCRNNARIRGTPNASQCSQQQVKTMMVKVVVYYISEHHSEKCMIWVKLFGFWVSRPTEKQDLVWEIEILEGRCNDM